MTRSRYEVETAGRERTGGGTGGHVIAAHRLSKAYRRRRPVLREVSFGVPPGLLVGIEGENGTGKSTLLKCLVGLLRPDSGRVEAAGRIGYCPQEPALVDLLTCREHLRMFGAGYRLSAAETARRGTGLMERFGCARYLDERIDRLSGGTRQKLNLIGALLADPDLLLLDEPYQGFDYETYLTFWEYAEQMRLDGRAVLVVSHMHAEQSRFDAMLVLRDGGLTAHGPAADRVGRAAP